MITKEEALLAAANAAARYELPWNTERVEARWWEEAGQVACWLVSSASPGAATFWQEQELDDNGWSLLIDGESGALSGLKLLRLTLSKAELERMRERRLSGRS